MMDVGIAETKFDILGLQDELSPKKLRKSRRKSTSDNLNLKAFSKFNLSKSTKVSKRWLIFSEYKLYLIFQKNQNFEKSRGFGVLGFWGFGFRV